MESRLIGGLKIPVLSFGTATFGGRGDFFSTWGKTQVDEAARLVDICLEAGVNMFDTADVYSTGVSEEILGKVIDKRRSEVIISTKSTFSMGDGPNDLGSSRYHIINALEASLRRLNTDYIDIYTMHGFDAQTPVEETLRTLDTLVQSGKVRYLACSNFSGWHLMKSLAMSDRYGWTRYAAHQAHYSLVGREYEWELMPLAIDQHVATIVWSPLAGGRLNGKYRRDQPLPDGRQRQGGGEGPERPELLYNIVDAMDEIAAETGKSSHADLAELAVAAPDRRQRDHRRAQRRAASRQSRRSRLELDAGADRQARRRQHDGQNLSLLAPERVLAQPLPGGKLTPSHRSIVFSPLPACVGEGTGMRGCR